MTIKRRDFICRAAASGAVLTLPGFLAGCGVQRATTLANAAPGNPFMDWFGIDEATTLRVMSELTANGADAADLYFQHTRNNSLALEGGIVSDAKIDIQQGVGLRVVIGEQTGYAFTEDLSLPSMLAAARAASVVAAGNKVIAPQAIAPKELGDMYPTRLPWADVGADQKVPILKLSKKRRGRSSLRLKRYPCIGQIATNA